METISTPHLEHGERILPIGGMECIYRDGRANNIQTNAQLTLVAQELHCRSGCDFTIAESHHQWLRILFRHEIFKDMLSFKVSYDEATNTVIATNEAWSQYA